MILTKIKLKIQSAKTQKMLSDCQYMHRIVTNLFGTDRKSSHILYRLRLERGLTALYLYSSQPINKERLLPEMTLEGERDLSDWIRRLKTGTVKRFDILVQPTKKVPSESGKNSQRRILREPEERMNWLVRKAAASGFEIHQCTEIEQISQFGKHIDSQGGTMHLSGYQYQGILQVTDEALFQQTFEEGIGAGKAYGFGMLLLS